MKAISFAESCLHPDLFGDQFAGESWASWRVIDKAMFGQELDETELATFTSLTGRHTAPTERASEVWLIVGRRGGKDVKAAALAVYLATIGVEIYGWRKKLSRGERGVVQLLAVDRDQAQVAFRYIAALFEKPVFRKTVKRQTADSIELTNGFAIEVTTADQRRVRGRTVVCCIMDEVAFWRSENTVSPDVETYNAIKPATATMPGAMIIGISSPYSKRGLLWRQYQRHYGQDGNVLVVQAPTWVMNPTVPRDGDIISEAYENEPEAAAAEYGAQFRNDVAGFIPFERVKACVEEGAVERPFDHKHRYIAFADPSGGVSDSFTLAIGHREGTRVILDAMREYRAPFDPEAITQAACQLLGQYKLTSVFGDKYAAAWVAGAFGRYGVSYLHSELNRSELYLAALPMLMSGECVLLDSDRLVNQFAALERRTGNSGKDSVDHIRGGKDDLANAVAGVLALADEAGPSREERQNWERLAEEAKERRRGTII
ncbi:hypothetical protein [Mesorhizobium captivum]|uniref:hypothetical protein n=1 Tax=Mesorhizobium captivum TaxID=3072319 RepID=UPI002A2426C1|nr:hypothetical protein [Mesorhizobium sp. VK3C]MDX8447058.1 hypothetical protein [Mesorhizobium sp. VK3C]